jgi:uncharacterized OsmC-like protein
MPEKVIVRQKSNFEIQFRAMNPEAHDSDELHTIESIYELTPYTMLLASLGACTTIVLHTYAQNHGIALDVVEAIVEYRRDFKEDCEKCEEIERYEEHINESVSFEGNLSKDEREKLQKISQRCSIHKILEEGLKIVHPTG